RELSSNALIVATWPWKAVRLPRSSHGRASTWTARSCASQRSVVAVDVMVRSDEIAQDAVASPLYFLTHRRDGGGIVAAAENRRTGNERVRACHGDVGDVVHFHAAIHLQPD